MPFSNEVKKNYIASGCMWCPKCGSSNFEVKGSPQINSPTQIKMAIACLDTHCKAAWDEVFTLSDIVEKE